MRMVRNVRKRRNTFRAVGNPAKCRKENGNVNEDTVSGYSRNGLVREIPGRIASVELINFMCHENLKIDFDLCGRNCFFIGGSNGSGKSALFAALNIGLGGRGNQNERGNAVKQYIRDGQNRAKIRILLTNRGFGRHPNYADAIAVERTMNLTSSTYQIKSITYEGGRCREEVISQKKTDLDKILARFSIQLENPIFWMSQNRCREFLQELKPKKLYKMFMFATGLDFSRHWYDEGGVYTAESERLVLSVREACISKKKEIEKLHSDRKRLQSVEENKRNLSELKKILPWLPVRDCDKDLHKHKALLDKAIAVLKSLKEGFIAKRERRTKCLEELDKERKEKDRLQKGVDDLRAELDELEKAKKCRREEMLDSGQRLSALERERKELEAEISSMEQQLKKIEAKKNKDFEAQHNIAETEAELSTLEKRYATLKEKKHRSEEAKQRFETQLAEALKAERNIEAEISHWNVTVRELCDEKERAMAMQRNDLARFGPSMPITVSLIEKNAAKFSKKPVGPIGAYLRLIDDSWAVAVEQCLRKLLSTFLCDNARDRNVLESLLHSHNIHSRRCIITKFTNIRYNTAANEPPPEYITVSKMLAISDNNVFNALIDQTQMESILLFESDNLARTLMSKNPPKNVRRGFTKNGDEVYAKTENQVYRFYANMQRQMSSTLISGKTANIKALSKEIAKAENELQKNNASLAEVRKNRQHIEAEMDSEVQLLSRTLQLMQVNETRKRALLKLLDTARFDGNVDDQIVNLVSSLNEYRKRRDDLSKRGKELQEELSRARQRVREAEELRVRKANDLAEKEEELRKSEMDLEGTNSKVDEMKDFENDHSQKLLKLESHKNDLENKVKILGEKLKEMKEEISMSVCGDPPDFTHLPDTVEAEEQCKKLGRQIQAAQESLEGTVITEEALTALHNDYERLRKKYANAKRVVLQMKDRINVRNEKFLEIRNATAERINEVYSRLMSIRNFKGSLIVDHIQQEIYIVAETQKCQEIVEDESDDCQRGRHILRDLKGLSGGERTYTSACFVMALWEAIETPFRCMDEFDVFLDLNNRKIVMELFADLATRQYPSHQFLFFTPQGIADFAHRNRVQLFEMPKVRK